jgi:hypothetical protein
MPLETFPSYDFPLWGNTPDSTESGGAEILPGNIDMPFGENYFGTGDSSGDKFQSNNVIPQPAFTLGTVANDFIGGTKTIISKPITAATGFFSGIVDSVKGTVRNTYFYLIGGIAIVGILAIVLLGASSRFMGKMEGN